jgi:curli biogenesis system outer membrane secretion channel CsgG
MIKHLLIALSLVACVPVQQKTKARVSMDVVSYPAPFLPISPGRRTIEPNSQFMKVAVLNFVDQTGRAPASVESLADMLATELHRSQRFEIFDRGQLRYYDYTQVLDECQKAKGKCASLEAAKAQDQSGRYAELGRLLSGSDAFLLCAITSATDDRVTFDYRLVNSNSFTVMIGGSATVPTDIGGNRITIARDAVREVASTIRTALPAPSGSNLGKVLVQDGRVLTINLGKKDGIISGMTVFVMGPGRIQLSSSQKPNTIDETYLAQAYVVSVYDNTSQVVVYNGTDFRVGDAVRFK